MFKYSAVIFDLDGTLVESEPIYNQGWIDGLKQYGFQATLEDLLPLHGQSTPYINNWLGEFTQKPDLIPALREHREKHIFNSIDAGAFPPVPGAMEMVRALKDRGVRMAVASSSDRNRVTAILNANGLLPYFELVVCGDDVAESKPDPSIYYLTLERGGFDSSNTLVFEDSIPGLKAGLNAYLPVVWLNTQGYQLSDTGIAPEKVPFIEEFGSMLEAYHDIFE